MNIVFELINNKTVRILSNKKEIGRLFVHEDYNNVVQLCGFDEAFDYWGCGVYGDKKTKILKKDMQFIFNEYTMLTKKDIQSLEDRFSFNNDQCLRCYNDPCTCEMRFDGIDAVVNPFQVKRLYQIKDLLDKKDPKKISTILNSKEDFSSLFIK